MSHACRFIRTFTFTEHLASIVPVVLCPSVSVNCTVHEISELHVQHLQLLSLLVGESLNLRTENFKADVTGTAVDDIELSRNLPAMFRFHNFTVILLRLYPYFSDDFPKGWKELNLPIKCFIRKSISCQLRIFSSVKCKQNLREKWWKTKARFRKSTRTIVLNTRYDHYAVYTEAKELKQAPVVQRLFSSNRVEWVTPALFDRGGLHCTAGKLLDNAIELKVAKPLFF